MKYVLFTSVYCEKINYIHCQGILCHILLNVLLKNTLNALSGHQQLKAFTLASNSSQIMLSFLQCTVRKLVQVLGKTQNCCQTLAGLNFY